jgi:AcrR family transcriptional regulator
VSSRKDVDARRTDTRARLIDATISRIDRAGYASLSAADVARACGVSAPAMYKHFPDRDALLLAALRELSARAAADAGWAGEAPPEAGREDPRGTLLSVGAWMMRWARDHPRLHDFLLHSPPALRASAEPGDGWEFPLLGVVRHSIEELRGRLGLDVEPERFLALVWATVEGAGALAARGVDGADPGLLSDGLDAYIEHFSTTPARKDPRP